MNKEKITENLKAICLNTQPITPETFKEHKYSKMWMREGINVFLSKEDESYYDDIIKEIITERSIVQNFAIADIEKSIQEIISRVLKLKTKKGKENKIVKEVNNLISELNKQIEEWEFIIPIENMDIVSRKFKIGEVELFKFTKYQYNKKLKEYKRILNANKYYKNKEDERMNIIEFFKRNNLKPLINYTCAKVIVKGTHSGAKQVALKKIDFELSLIKLSGYYNDSSNRMYFGIKGEIIPYITRTIIGKKTNGNVIYPTMEKTGCLQKFVLGSTRRIFMRKNGFDKIRKLITKMNKTDFDNKLLNAIFWYSKAYDIPETKKVEDKKVSTRSYEEVEYFNLGDKYLKLMIAMECLLIFGRENKSYNIKTRSSYILTDDKEQREKLQKYIQKAYETRSKIVHKGGYIISKVATNSFMNYVQATIIALIKSKDKWRIRRNEDFYQWCEKNRLLDRL